MYVGIESLFPDFLDTVPPEDREEMADVIKNVFGEAFSSTTYLYDTQGRLLELNMRIGSTDR